MNADLDFAPLPGLDDGEELDGVAELCGETDIRGGDFLDALDVNLVRADPETIGKGSEDDGLVGGVPAVDVEGWIGLCESGILGLA